MVGAGVLLIVSSQAPTIIHSLVCARFNQFTDDVTGTDARLPQQGLTRRITLTMHSVTTLVASQVRPPKDWTQTRLSLSANVTGTPPLKTGPTH